VTHTPLARLGCHINCLRRHPSLHCHRKNLGTRRHHFVVLKVNFSSPPTRCHRCGKRIKTTQSCYVDAVFLSLHRVALLSLFHLARDLPQSCQVFPLEFGLASQQPPFKSRCQALGNFLSSSASIPVSSRY